MVDASEEPIIVPLLTSGWQTRFSPAILTRDGQELGSLRFEGLSQPRILKLMRHKKGWTEWNSGHAAADRPPEMGLGALPLPGPREFMVVTDKGRRKAVVSPVLLASSLDPPTNVFVVRNKLSADFAAALARIVEKVEGKPTLHFLDHDDASSDFWIQDAVEFAVSAFPNGRRAHQTVVPLLGLRAKHDMGLNCGPLDNRVREYLRQKLPDTALFPVGEPLPQRRWIDWYGNLEVSPPVPGFRFGRILTGEQKGLRIHPDLLAFLEAQTYQWPPLFLDVSWLTIGHVDELINFVPARGRKGFRVLLPSPTLARNLLESAVQAGQGEATVFTGKKRETTVARLLEKIGRSSETTSIENALRETQERLKEGLGIDTADIVEMPVLFEGGLAVIPNGVNSLVLGKDIVIPDPCGPEIGGEDIFRRAIRERLTPLGLRLHFVDIWDPYHVRAGEIHCGTNAIRRLKNAVWWK